MKREETTASIIPGAVILTGTAYYRVTRVFPRKVRGQRWDEDWKAWGGLHDVPLPSPTAAAYVLSVSEVSQMFPLEE